MLVVVVVHCSHVMRSYFPYYNTVHQHLGILTWSLSTRTERGGHGSSHTRNTLNTIAAELYVGESVMERKLEEFPQLVSGEGENVTKGFCLVKVA